MAYVGFKALVAKGVPPGAAANIGRRKYGKEAMDEAARKHQTLEGAETVKEKRRGVHVSRGDWKKRS